MEINPRAASQQLPPAREEDSRNDATVMTRNYDRAVVVDALGAEVLDRPAWESLHGAHARFAQLHGRAARYDPQFAAFHCVAGPFDAAAWHDLHTLAGPRAAVMLAGPDPVPPPDWTVTGKLGGVQFVGGAVDGGTDPEAVTLTVADVPEILDLVRRTEPGPFRARTVELGTYLGIRHAGALVAMAGERLRPQGWTEISAVCTDPAYRGRGLATRLIRSLVDGIRQRGDTPFLHTAANNATAIRLYESLGFTLRKQITFALLHTPTA